MLFKVAFNRLLVKPGLSDQVVLGRVIFIITAEFFPAFTFCSEKTLLGFGVDHQ